MILELSQVVVQISMLSLETIATLLVSIVLPIILVSMLSFVPAFIELKKPRDSGPRLIAGESIGSFHNILLLDAETNPITVNPAPKIPINFPIFLANLEA